MGKSRDDDSDREKRRKAKKKHKKLKKKMKKKQKDLERSEKKAIKKRAAEAKELEKKKAESEVKTEAENSAGSRSMAPMTKEEWEKRQSVVRRVLDPTTGRFRLIKGDGEVIEEIVSRDRHKEINRQATQGDGNYFQSFFKK